MRTKLEILSLFGESGSKLEERMYNDVLRELHSRYRLPLWVGVVGDVGAAVGESGTDTSCVVSSNN